LACQNIRIEASMFQVLLSLLLLASAVGFPQTPKSAPVEQQDAKPRTAQQPSDSQPAPQTPEKTAAKPKKVITNDDLKPARGGGFSVADFAEINDCDRTCFEQVRQLARVAPASNPNWKRDLLAAVDTVRKNAEWQGYLHSLYDIHLKFCQFGAEKRDELAKNADPHNVTPREIAIDDKYDAKFKQAQAELQEVYSRQAALQGQFGGNAFALQFSSVQTSRIQNAPCEQHWYPSATPTDTENESRDEDQ
jgi:hypothetical protein